MAPISLIMIIRQTNPFWTSLVAYKLLAEPILRFEVVGMLICFTAVIVIGLQEYFSAPEVEEGNGQTFLGLALSLVGAIFLALNQVLNRSLKDTPVAVIIFFHSLGGILVLATMAVVESTAMGYERDYTSR